MLFLARRISLDQLPKTLPEFYQRLVTIEYIYFTREPFKDNIQWERKFYSNLKELNLATPVIKIVCKTIDFEVEEINKSYRLVNLNHSGKKIVFRVVDWHPRFVWVKCIMFDINGKDYF